MKFTVDAMGDACPIPVIKTKKALGEAGENAEIEVLVDNETAVKNVTKMAQSTGAEVSSEKIAGGQYRVLIQTGAGQQSGGNTDGAQEEFSCDCGKESISGDTIVIVSSDKMGEGADELGHILMKSFLFAVTQLVTLPAKMVFYNGGAKLTVEGSPALEDLKSLEEQGVEIMTCGTCLDYYGLKEKLAVGTVTNMYSIVETMQQAGRVIRP
ncbi:MAG TPA: sulfurtransferase-like selenium metabolism protein YedF [Candidatus Mediterraneibacter cottocaccae]|nr:sulfurtransferase-like selenium metabolism protein YedF [Candidatus Mediterraneibacter cottocaccae]